LEQGKIEERGVSSEHIHNRSVNANQDTNQPINLLQQNHLLNLISHYGKAFFPQKVNQFIHLQCFKVIWNWIVQIPSRLHPHHMKKKEQSHEATHCNLLNKRWKKSMSIHTFIDHNCWMKIGWFTSHIWVTQSLSNGSNWLNTLTSIHIQQWRWINQKTIYWHMTWLIMSFESKTLMKSLSSRQIQPWRWIKHKK